MLIPAKLWRVVLARRLLLTWTSLLFSSLCCLRAATAKHLQCFHAQKWSECCGKLDNQAWLSVKHSCLHFFNTIVVGGCRKDCGILGSTHFSLCNQTTQWCRTPQSADVHKHSEVRWTNTSSIFDSCTELWPYNILIKFHSLLRRGCVSSLAPYLHTALKFHAHWIQMLPLHPYRPIASAHQFRVWVKIR